MLSPIDRLCQREVSRFSEVSLGLKRRPGRSHWAPRPLDPQLVCLTSPWSPMGVIAESRGEDQSRSNDSNGLRRGVQIHILNNIYIYMFLAGISPPVDDVGNKRC